MSGGYRKYLQELLPRLARHLLIKEIQVFIRSEFIPLIATSIPATHIHACEDTLAGRRQLKDTLSKISPDVVFFPILRGIRSTGTPAVYMVQNMEPLTLPFGGNSCTVALKNLARRFVAKAACRRATRILAISHFVKDFLVKTWHINPGKIGMVYYGANERYTSFEGARPSAIPSNWQDGFLFTAGSIRPARGLEDLIRALAELAAAGIRLPLLIGGVADPSSLSYEGRMRELTVNLGIQNQVVWTGYLTQREMAWCYSRASLFIMTSRVEAFGLIALEAMSHGQGFIAADNPCLPEIFRDSARYYVPGDSRSLAEAITAYQASSTEVQRDQRLRARAYAAKFTWDRTAEETVKELMVAWQSDNK